MAGLSEQTARDLIHKIGQLDGTVRGHIETQKEFNKSVVGRLEKQDEKIDLVEDDISGYKKLVRGVIIGVGLGGTSIGAALMKAAGVVEKVATGGGQ